MHFGSATGSGGEVPLDAQHILAQEFRPAPKRNMRLILLLLLGIAALALIYFGVTALTGPKAPPPFQDLGAGVSNADGLRGNLSTRWAGRAEYQLKFQALNPYEDKAFPYVVGHPPRPFSFHIRLLDSTGFVLCSKEIVFPLNVARVEVAPLPFPELVPKATGLSAAAKSAAPAAQGEGRQLAKSNDVFQDQVGDDGQITSFTAQGVLPCTAAQYRQFSYWDFSTNFPTLAEQQAIAEAPILAAQRKAAAERKALQRKWGHEYPSAFYLNGDSTVSEYDSTSSVLRVASGQRFRVLNKNNAAVANSWASEGAQVHYKCDQYATCQLTTGSPSGTIVAKSIP